MTKRVIEGEQSTMGTIFFIFKVNTVEKVLRDLFQLETVPLNVGCMAHVGARNHSNDLEINGL